ncbi:MAG: response regulator transcription factor [Saprospiraceae bacterium]|nr:response regulator transcription factor [Saprospiraceae bacterium]
MPRVVIIEDETNARNNLRRMLTWYCPTVIIVGEAESVSGGLEEIRRHAPEIVFLDIAIKEGTGFDLLAHFPHPGFGVIFTTAFDHFALRAFEFNTIDYLLKPIVPEDLRRAVRKAQMNRSGPLYPEQLGSLMKSVHNSSFEKIALSTSEGLIFLRLKELVRLEAGGSYTTFFFFYGKPVTVARSLREFEKLLPPTKFFRIHQSHLVNLHFVESVLKEDGGYALMEDTSRLPISRRRKDAFIFRLKEMSID